MASGHENPPVAGDKMDFTDLYFNMMNATVYHICRIFFNVVRTLFWLINGTMIELWNSSKPKNYDSCAHVYDILYRYKFDLILGQASFEDFILTHDKFAHPAYLLRDECVLYQVTHSHAIFVQVGSGVDIWRGEHGSFLRQAQFLQAKKVITLPLHAMEQLADEISPSDSKLIFIQNTARCGSTLLVRMFEETRRCVTFCEPDAVNGICKLARTKKLWDEQTGIRIVRSLVRVMCKPVSSLNKSTLAYILKMTSPSMEAAPFVAKAFPEAYHMFMYRDCMKICQSLAVAAEVMPTLKLVFLMGSIHAKGLQFAVSQMGCSSTEFNLKLSGHPYEAGIVLFGITIRKYMQMLNSGIRICGVRYEDLAEDAEYFMEQVLNYCNLPVSLVQTALEATKKDAQKNSALSISNLKTKKKNYKMTPAVEAFRDKWFKDMQITTEPTPIFTNTITHRSSTENEQEAQKPLEVKITEAKNLNVWTEEVPIPTEPKIEQPSKKESEIKRKEYVHSAGNTQQAKEMRAKVEAYVSNVLAKPIQEVMNGSSASKTTIPKQQQYDNNKGKDMTYAMSGTKKVKIIATLTRTETRNEEIIAAEMDKSLKGFECVDNSEMVRTEPNEEANITSGLNNVEKNTKPTFIKF